MVLFPRQGAKYWFVTDIWEKHVAVPVTMENKSLKWDLGDGDYELYKISRNKLYKNQKRAAYAAAKINRKAVR